MRIVVDSNIVFSAILNSNSKIAQIILQPKTGFNFYSTNQLIEEIETHREKIQEISGYSNQDLQKAISLITRRIRFINIKLVPLEIYLWAEQLTINVDIDDTEFVALAEHVKAKLWTGDKRLINGLKSKKWEKFTTTEELYKLANKRK